MKALKKLQEILGRENYSNIHLAFYKLHALKFLDEKEINKKDFLESLLKSIDENYLNHALERFKSSMDKVFQGFDEGKRIELKAKIGYRFVTGMGYPSVIENGFLFHFTYGIPYIPAETVKGLVRSTFLYTEFPEKEEKELKKISELLEEGKYEDKDLQEHYEFLFGTKNKEGEIIYLDAFPAFLRMEDFAIDVMNPHYSEYYSDKGKEPPVEWESPKPIFFLTLENTKFIFRICLKNSAEKKYLEEVKDLLKTGLETFGVGGKRRKGYGWFEVAL